MIAILFLLCRYDINIHSTALPNVLKMLKLQFSVNFTANSRALPASNNEMTFVTRIWPWCT